MADAPEPGAAPVDNEAGDTGSKNKNEISDPNKSDEEELLTKKSMFGIDDSFDLER